MKSDPGATGGAVSDDLIPAGMTTAAVGIRPAGAATAVTRTQAAEDLWLLRRYEPVLRFTQGELFLPMPIELYLDKCSLWRSASPGENSGRAAIR